MKARTIAIGIAFLAIGLTSCSSDRKAAFRVGINVWPGYEIISLAESLGYFGEEGVKIDIVEFESLSDARRALESGKVDAIGTTTVELLMMRARTSKRAKVMRVFDFSNGADMIITPVETKSLAQLRGKPVGLEVSSVSIFVLGRALELEGLELRDVKTVSTHQLAMAEMLRSGKMAAVVTYPPTSVELLKGGKFHVLFDSSRIPGEVIDILAVDLATANARADDLAAFGRALDRAFVYYTQNRRDAIERMARRERLPNEEFEKIVTEEIRMIAPEEQAEFLRPGGAVDMSIRNTARFLHAIDILPTDEVPADYLP